MIQSCDHGTADWLLCVRETELKKCDYGLILRVSGVTITKKSLLYKSQEYLLKLYKKDVTKWLQGYIFRYKTL